MRVLERVRITASAVALLAAACGGRGDRPNIVILVSDDQDYEHLGFLGNEQARMPTIDALAANGVVFPYCFVPMSRCRPAQASLLSGQWPHQSGVYFNVAPDHIDPDTSLVNRLADEGYRARGEGKFWEHDPRVMGFTNRIIKNFESFVRRGQEPLFEWIRANAGEAPLFIWWAPELPHEPHDPPQRFLDLVDAGSIEIPDWFQGREQAFRRRERLSLAMGAWLDEGVRELMDVLEDEGELENTLLLFWIDNGWANGLPSKGTAYDKGLRTPAVLTWPGGIEGGRTFDELVSCVDLYATLLDFGGAAIPAASEGQSLRPLLEGAEHSPREALYGAVYTQTPTRLEADAARDAYGLWARTERWKYVLYLRDVTEADDDVYHLQYNLCAYPERRRGDEELFDLAHDPYELVDLADDPTHRAVADRLRGEALAWWRATGGRELALP